MPRRPEIGNVQLYPDRPLRKSDRNGYVLKFYCPIRCKRIRRNCGTRDRREARRMQRECRERLLNGEYLGSDGAISASHVAESCSPEPVVADHVSHRNDDGPTWQDCYERYLEHRRLRVREDSLVHLTSRLSIAERILEAAPSPANQTEGLLMSDVATLNRLEYLQERLLAGDECRYDSRSPNTVNSLMATVLAFIRFCQIRGWVTTVPPLEKLDADEVMKGRPISDAEFQQMLEATPSVVGQSAADSWIFALKVLWESGFRVGDLMDFSWDDSRHIHPVWPTRQGQYPTIVIVSSQKNGRVQEIPMLPGLVDLLESVPAKRRRGWVVNPEPVEFEIAVNATSFRPTPEQLLAVATGYSNWSIAEVCGVSEAAVRNWISELPTKPDRTIHLNERIPEKLVARMKKNPLRSGSTMARSVERFSVERVSRIICRIGEAAGVIVQHADKRTGQRKKFASAHDIRRGCAQRLINLGVSAETLKVIMRHASFSTTEKHYGAVRSAQNAAAEVAARMTTPAQNSAFVGGLVGGMKKAPQLSAEELLVLKSLLAKL
ncbi:MAG: tyrosine-type recombinase/integrase [Planctomycetaceae bacterium]|nr:tyrosine-type recombinase/integrase [Planctomycetaceae bacterium]